MKVKNQVWTIFILLASFQLKAQKQIIYANKSYEPFIKTVQLYPNNETADRAMQAPILSLNSRSGLILEFDALLEDYVYLQAKIIHCNADWTPSRMPDMDILADFNAFDLNDFEYSVNTKTLFVHYTFQVPVTRKSGNYILLIYQNSDADDLVLTRRFMVYENEANINATVRVSSGVSVRNFNQQIEFSLNYGEFRSINPLFDFHVVVRQNQRWDNALIGLKPTLVRRDENYLEYHHFTMENNFKGGNEFRFLDLSTYSYRGQNIGFINKKSNPITAITNIDLARNRQAYSQFRDINGQYFIMTKEPLADNLEADYIDLTFQLSSKVKLLNDVYVLGAFNDWSKLPEYKLNYDKARELYWKTISLKQGYYSYMYDVDSDSYYFEGSHFQTENQYEILVYYKEPGNFGDRLIGYKSFNSGMQSR